ncbi:MAG: hypothetical protein IMY79_02375 [Chloroflexi bacterium]|jgi:hypothetical protein|nr:hypothetical protein [Chloroflexota bacterium]
MNLEELTLDAECIVVGTVAGMYLNVVKADADSLAGYASVTVNLGSLYRMWCHRQRWTWKPAVV